MGREFPVWRHQIAFHAWPKCIFFVCGKVKSTKESDLQSDQSRGSELGTNIKTVAIVMQVY